MQRLRVFLTILCLSSVVTLSSFIELPVQSQNLTSSQTEQLLKQAAFFVESNQLLAAQTKLEQALRLALEDKDFERQKDALTSLGGVYYRQGRYVQATEFLQRSQSIPGNASQKGKLSSAQGLVYLELGEYRQALTSFQLAQGTQLQDINEENRNQIGLGETYRYLGLYAQSLQILQQSVRVAGDRTDRGQILNAIGNVYYDLGEYDSALDYYQQALTLRYSVGDRYGVARTQNNLGRTYNKLGKPSQALEFYQQALNLSNSLGDEFTKVNTRNSLGLIYAETGKNKEALSYLQQALGSDNIGRIQTLNNLGWLHTKLGKYPEARDFYEQALSWAKKNGDRTGEAQALSGLGANLLKSGEPLKAIEFLKLAISVFESLRPGLRDEQKVAIFETHSDAYQTLQTALVSQNKYTEALIASERGRARAFVELLAKRLSPANESVTPLTLKQIQATAKQHQATIVSYSIVNNESDLYIWVVAPDGKLTFRQVNLKKAGIVAKNPQLLTNLVETLRQQILSKKTANKTVVASSRNAYNVLIQPVADLLPTEAQAQVIFIPQGSLFLVPFAALQDSSGKFLIEQHTISIAPSIQALSLIQPKPQTNKLEVLIVGNPQPISLKLPALPGAETEAMAIAKLFNTSPLIGRQATESAVSSRMSKAQVIHLATHGFFDDRQGLESSLALVAAPGDGLLTAAEILELKLPGSLVVLSACNTGRGKITGDGVIGLSRSLLSSGASTVIVSLWSVPDLPTAALMTEFYNNLNKQNDNPQALRQAMLLTMKQTPSPRDWAGFVSIGVP
ncbi:CHAT domain-containing protein [Synechocystis sp. PCC 7509]|uniref:CHAT domain-containing protein n=1 Tax=Synechocystis sp. PCC 7509 TaxID=927677 RepID=UPI0002AC99C4|nr:CHAT domain-containing tetratricopeptide repeat protein [Synechocystis sp. PCC 7509]